MTLRNSFVLFFVVFSTLAGCASTDTITTTITSEPSDAWIYWGKSEDDLGFTNYKTPYVEYNRGPDPSWKDWFYQVKKDGYKDSRVVFKPKTKSHRVLHFELKPIGVDYRYGALTIVSDPPGAHVVEKSSGEYIGRTPTTLKLYRRNIITERAEIENIYVLEKRDFRPMELRVGLTCEHKSKAEAEGNPRAVFTMLEAIEGDPIWSTVQITSEPSNASVYFNGQFLGRTPLTQSFYWRSSAMSYELLLEKTGFQGKRTNFGPDDEEISVVLQPSIPAPR